jgi:hypothetical protein
MFAKDLDFYHSLLILSKLKYDSETKKSISEKFVVAQFAEHVTKQLPSRENAGSTTIQNCFSDIYKGNYDKMRNKVAKALSIYCEYQDFDDFKDKAPKINNAFSELVEDRYEWVQNQGVLPINICEEVLKSMRIDIFAIEEKKTPFPDNWLEDKFCNDLEFETPNIMVYVITSNLKWAHHYKDRVSNAVKINNARFRYLLTSSKGAENLYLMEDLIEEQGLLEGLKVVELSAPVKKEKYKVKKEHPLLQEVAGVAFPLPSDIVIYVGIPDEKAKSHQKYIFKDKAERNAIAVIGTTPFDFDAEKQKIRLYYDIAVEGSIAKGILGWFTNVWEILTGERI